MDDDAGPTSLLPLAWVGRLRERKAQARRQRARQASRALEQACHLCESNIAELERAQEQARVVQLQRLQTGRVASGLHDFIHLAERRWRDEQVACALAHERWRAGLLEVRQASQALAASEERRRVYDEMLEQWHAEALARMDEDGEGG